MATVHLDDNSFREAYQNNNIVILDFWAPWCGPCHQFAPIFEEVSDLYPDIVFGKVDTEMQRGISSYFGVLSIPTIVVIREQLEVFRHSGVVGSKALKQLIEQVRNADMDDIRKQMEDESAENSDS